MATDVRGKGGRPKLGQDAKRSKQAYSSFTEKEYDALEALAKSQGLSVSAYIRFNILKEIQQGADND